jgi:cytochrome c
MTRTHIAALLISSLILLLYGCQPDAPAQQPWSAPVISAPAASQVPGVVPSEAAKQEPKTGEVAVSGAKERGLAQKSGCFACHTIEKKVVGPAWTDIATKYRGQKDAEVMLIAKVSKGGSGVWSSTPMPPNSPKVSEGDIKTLVRFILSLK